MKKILLVILFVSSNACLAADYPPLGYESGSTIEQDTVRDQWQEMREQPALTETSGVYNPVQEFFKINTKRVKPTAKSKLAKGKKGKKGEVLDEAKKEASLAAESKIDGKPNLDVKPSVDGKPKTTDSKALSADGTTKSEF